MSYVVQVLSGLIVSVHFRASYDRAFNSVLSLTRDANHGYVTHNIHTFNCRRLFLILYTHIAKSWLYTFNRSVPSGNTVYHHSVTYISGWIIFVVTRLIAFCGYAIAFGNRSYWGIRVIWSFAWCIDSVYNFRRSGFVINSLSISKLYSRHFVLPFIWVVLSVVHRWLLHSYGSSFGIRDSTRWKDKHCTREFALYFGTKDYRGLSIYILVRAIMLLYRIRYSVHPDNSVVASPTVTPSHIVPEWYFLSSYRYPKVTACDPGIYAFALSVLVVIGLSMSRSNLHVIRLFFCAMVVGSLLSTTSSESYGSFLTGYI
jgi:ubiquinol-cytochrome c reductase cytochrome b subunit